MTGALLREERSALVVVDIQEKLAPAMRAGARTIARTAILVAAARAVAVPVLASVQYPQGLGPLVPALAEAIAGDEQVAKTHFSALAEAAFAGRFRALGRPQAVVTGMEAHVCVLQTAMDLLAQRFEVFVVADGVDSRSEQDHALALARLAQAGAAIVSTEMVVFEWLGRADRPQFRALSALIR